MSSWLDLLPSSERNKLRTIRKRSPEEYEALREKIKSVDQISEEMDRNSELAELAFALETEPVIKDALKKQIDSDMNEKGIEGVLYSPDGIPEETKAALQQGSDIHIDANPDTQEDQILISPEGNVSEKLPIKFSLSEQYVSQFTNVVSGEDV